jgi:hypothetical protein
MRQVMSNLVNRAFAEYDMAAAGVMGARIKLAAMEDWHEGAPGGWLCVLCVLCVLYMCVCCLCAGAIRR